MLRINLTTDEGRSRAHEFHEDEILIGFRSGAHVVLKVFEDDMGEVRIKYRADHGYEVLPQFNPGYYKLNGQPITQAEPLKLSDRITCGPYTLNVMDMDIADEPATRMANSDDAIPPPLGQTGAAPAPRKPKVRSSGGADYLILFFQPIAQYLQDEDVSEIMINGPDQIYIERKGKLEKVPETFSNEAALCAACKNVGKNIGRQFDEDNPRLDARLPDGSRVHAVIPPLARQGTVVAIRKFSKESLSVSKLIDFGSLSQPAADFIDVVVKQHRNIIVSGATSSGKTSVLNVLSSCIPEHERILVIEDASELQLQQPHAVYFETRKPDDRGKGEVTIRDLVHSTLRLRPDRLVIGEIRGGEALDLLQALNTGHAGSMSTIHANSPVDALSRIEVCALLSGVDMPLSALRSQVASAVNMVVHTARLSDGSRKVTHITEVLGLKDGEYHCQDLIRFETGRLDEEGKIIGNHKGCGVLPTFFEDAVMAGLPIAKNWFEVG